MLFFLLAVFLYLHFIFDIKDFTLALGQTSLSGHFKVNDIIAVSVHPCVSIKLYVHVVKYGTSFKLNHILIPLKGWSQVFLHFTHIVLLISFLYSKKIFEISLDLGCTVAAIVSTISGIKRNTNHFFSFAKNKMIRISPEENRNQVNLWHHDIHSNTIAIYVGLWRQKCFFDLHIPFSLYLANILSETERERERERHDVHKINQRYEF